MPGAVIRALRLLMHHLTDYPKQVAATKHCFIDEEKDTEMLVTKALSPSPGLL